ncbi:efflux RND transporter periplasmic adaptor subunit, partial [bacterium]|nr:efflux RND transporter periplasmic adaptor subunit [bacterium]
MTYRSRLVSVVYGPALLLVVPALFVAGCRKSGPTAPPAGPPAVPVSHPVSREVTEYVEYTGRVDAVESVGIRARVTGFLLRTPFAEGAEVRRDDLLFEIDPRPYQAQLDQAESQVRLYEARVVEAEKNRERARVGAKAGAASQAELDAAEASVKAAAAQVEAAQASVELYRLNLGFTKVYAPIDGQVSRYYYTPGNLVSQDSTLLTTVVSTDPVYVYFDMDERTVVRVRTGINQGKIRPPRSAAVAL